MITPGNRREFERHLNMLFEGIEQGKHHISPRKNMINSLLNAKKSPNMRADFLTIDETVRLMANSRVTFSSPQFLKKYNAKQ